MLLFVLKLRKKKIADCMAQCTANKPNAESVFTSILVTLRALREYAMVKPADVADIVRNFQCIIIQLFANAHWYKIE